MSCYINVDVSNGHMLCGVANGSSKRIIYKLKTSQGYLRQLYVEKNAHVLIRRKCLTNSLILSISLMAIFNTGCIATEYLTTSFEPVKLKLAQAKASVNLSLF